MSARQRLTFAGIAVLIAVVAIVIAVASGGSDDGSKKASATATATATAAPGTTPTATAQAEAKPKPTVIVVKGGQPVGGIRKIKVNQGDRIAFSVKSDTADEIHVHGFDFHKDVAKGGTVSFSFPAKITGVFEVELEAAKVQLAQLTVEP